ncbi:MAG: hypothetical protein JWM82_4105 [Myxococcales bacterium]|nr:hypothetical protein [Myxococcales bacterium]
MAREEIAGRFAHPARLASAPSAPTTSGMKIVLSRTRIQYLRRRVASQKIYRLQYWMPRSILVGAKTLLTSMKQPLSRTMRSSLG